MRPSKAITTKYSMAFTLALAAVSLMSSDPVHGFTTPSVGSPTLSSHIRVSSPATLSRSPTQLHVSQIASNDNKSEGAERQNHHNQALEVTIQDLNLIEAEATGDEAADSEFLKGFGIIALITLFNASLSPVWHQVYLGNGPPPLFLNAAVSIVAFLGLITGAPLLESSGLDKNSALKQEDSSVEKWSKKSFLGGMELGLWKGLGTTCHIYGMALTTANHGAFLLQLTTLIVPMIQGLNGEKIPRQIQVAVGLALTGILLFTQDPTKASEIIGDPSLMRTGDAMVLAAAFFYSLYDIQTFYWGREVPRTELVTIKVGFQSILSILLCAIGARTEIVEYLAAGPEWNVLVPTVLWSGLIVNALATFLQVGGMQAVGPTRAQTIFASQPLWASILNYFLLGSVMGTQGYIGGGAFMGALVLAATADTPLPDANSELKGTEEKA